MDGPPNHNNIDWENFMAGDPYQPEDLPIPDLSEEEEDPSEDEIEDEEEYEPYEVPESDEEYIPQDAQMDEDPEESLTDEEVVTPPPPPPPQMPRCPHSNRILPSRTPRMNIPPTHREDLYSFVPLAISTQQRRNADIPAHYEIGESSQAPQPDHPAPQDNGLVARVQHLEELLRASGSTSRTFEQRLERLEEEERSDTEAIQLLYHRMGASRTEANTMSAQIRALEYRAQIAESRLDAAEYHVRMAEQRADATEQRADIAEQERRQLQERYDDLVRLRGNRFRK